MMPGNYPLALYSGDSYEWQFKLWLDAGKTQPLDLTDVVAKAEIREKPGGSDIYPLQCAVVLPNIVTMNIGAEDCGKLPIAALAWDLQLTYPTGAVNTILAGKVTVTEDVTDSVIEPPVVVEPAAMSLAVMVEDTPAPTTDIVRAPRVPRVVK